jgi:hypothetical protein
MPVGRRSNAVNSGAAAKLIYQGIPAAMGYSRREIQKTEEGGLSRQRLRLLKTLGAFVPCGILCAWPPTKVWYNLRTKPFLTSILPADVFERLRQRVEPNMNGSPVTYFITNLRYLQ